jgi:hypothetical protein
VGYRPNAFSSVVWGSRLGRGAWTDTASLTAFLSFSAPLIEVSDTTTCDTKADCDFGAQMRQGPWINPPANPLGLTSAPRGSVDLAGCKAAAIVSELHVYARQLGGHAGTA